MATLNDLKHAWFAEVLGYSPEDAVGKSITDLEYEFFLDPPEFGGGGDLDGQVTIRPDGANPAFVVRNAADTSTVAQIASSGSYTTAGGSVTAGVSGANAFVAAHAQGGIRFGGTASTTFIQRNNAAQQLISDSAFRVRSTTTGGRPAANSVAVGSQIWDSTLNLPIWSDGANWINAAGSTV